MYFVVEQGKVLLNSQSVNSIEIVKSKDENFSIVVRSIENTYYLKDCLTIDQARLYMKHIRKLIDNIDDVIDLNSISVDVDSSFESIVTKMCLGEFNESN